MRTASASCHPIVYTGFSDVIGSWKIMARRLPRSWLSSFTFMPSSSMPLNFTDPVTLAVRGSRPMTASDVTDLPEPDSPTTARTSPGRRL